MLRTLRRLAGVIALTLASTSATAEAIAKIAVTSAGTVALNGQPTTLTALDAALKQVKAQNGVVWYHRANPGAEPHPNAMAVVQLVIKHALPVSMSSKPDFSDYVDASGVSKPRK